MEIWFVILEYSKKNELLCVKVVPTPTPPSLHQVLPLNTRPLLFKTAFDLASNYANQKNVEIRRM